MPRNFTNLQTRHSQTFLGPDSWQQLSSSDTRGRRRLGTKWNNKSTLVLWSALFHTSTALRELNTHTHTHVPSFASTSPRSQSLSLLKGWTGDCFCLYPWSLYTQWDRHSGLNSCMGGDVSIEKKKAGFIVSRHRLEPNTICTYSNWLIKTDTPRFHFGTTEEG